MYLWNTDDVTSPSVLLEVSGQVPVQTCVDCITGPDPTADYGFNALQWVDG